MGMDDEWKRMYRARASQEIPDYKKGFWTEDGYNQLMQTTLDLVKKIKSQIKSVVDVGCGVGGYCSEISKMGFDVVGVDYTEELVKEAKKNFPELKFEVGNGYMLRFNDKSFDLAISIGALQCLEDHRKFISELCRVSKKYLILSTLLNEEGRDADEYLKEALENDTWPTREYNPEHLVEIFKENGFDCDVITHKQNALIKDGFFIFAKRR